MTQSLQWAGLHRAMRSSSCSRRPNAAAVVLVAMLLVATHVQLASSALAGPTGPKPLLPQQASSGQGNKQAAALAALVISGYALWPSGVDLVRRHAVAIVLLAPAPHHRVT